MTIIVPGAEQRVAARAISGTSEEFRRMDLSDAFGGVGADLLVKAGGIVEGMAEREDEQMRLDAKQQMITDLAAFDIDNERRVDELSQNSPGRGLTKKVMEDFNDRKQEIVDAQPNFLKGETSARTLPLQVRQAKSAIGRENAYINQQREARAQTFRDSIVNSVRFGRETAEAAGAKVEDFVATLPANAQEATRRNLTESVKVASLANLIENDHRSALTQIKGGEHNDISPNTLQSMYNQALKKEAAEKSKIPQLDKLITKNRTTDPVVAAQAHLLKQGIETPTQQQLAAAQSELGIPQNAQAVLTKAQAEEFTFQLANVQNVDDFKSLKREQATAWAQNGISPDDAVRDMIRLSNAPENLKAAMLAPDDAPAAYYKANLDLLRDPDAGTQALNSLKSIRNNRINKDHNRAEKLMEAIAAESTSMQNLLMRGGTPFSEAAPQVEAFRNAAYIMTQDAMANGGRLPTVEELQDLTSQSRTFEIRHEGLTSVMMPKDVDPVFGDNLEPLREEIIDSNIIEIPEGYPSDDVGLREIQEDSGWAMVDNDTMVLMLNQQPLTYKGTNDAIYINHMQLREMLVDDKIDYEDMKGLIVRNAGGRVVEQPLEGGGFQYMLLEDDFE